MKFAEDTTTGTKWYGMLSDDIAASEVEAESGHGSPSDRCEVQVQCDTAQAKGNVGVGGPEQVTGHAPS